jgi:hypothetical protein
MSLPVMNPPSGLSEMGGRMPALLGRSHGKRIQDDNT